jgi:hypothetical protein
MILLLLFTNPALTAAVYAEAGAPAENKTTAASQPSLTFTVEKPTPEIAGEKAAAPGETEDTSTGGKRIGDQEKMNSFANRLLAYYLRNSQKGGPSWMKTTDIQLRFPQDNQPIYSFETIQPFGDIRKDGSLWFWQGRYARLSADNGSTANLGLGWRKLSADKTSLVGLNLFYDYGFQYQLQRIGLGAEYFHKQMEYRFNYYYPVSGDKQTGMEYQDTGILYSYIRAVEGFDYELGTSLPKAPWWKLYVGGYHWDNKYNPDENGFRLRSNMQLTPRVAVEIGYQSSNLASGNLYGKISYQLADALGPAFWGSLPMVDGKPIPVLVQLYQNGKPIGTPILVNAAKLSDKFSAKATPVNASDLALRSKDDVSVKMLQKVERENEIKTEKWTKFVAYTGSIAVSVTGSNGGGVRGVSLQAYQNGSAVGSAVTSDASGKALFSGLTVGTYSVKATYFSLSADSGAVTVVKDQTAQASIALAVSSGGITVNVTDSSGAPVSGATVTIQASGATAQGEKSFFDRLLGVKTAYAASGFSFTVTTGADGTASFPSLPPGSYLFNAVYGTQVVTSSTITLPTGGGTVTSYVVLSGSGMGSAAITVTDGTNAISGATVSVTASGATQTSVTDSKGVATLGKLPPGTQAFTVSKSGYVDNTLGVTIASGVTTAATIPLAAQTGSAVLTVTDGTKPLVGATVSVTVGGGAKTAVTNASGAATFPSLPIGTYPFTATLAGYGDGTVSLAITHGGVAAATIPLTAQVGKATVTVTDASNAPVSGATVSVTVGGTTKTATSGADGTAVFASLPIGTYSFTAVKTNYSTGEASATVTNGGSVALAIPISQLTSSANITVTDGTNPISGATVNVSVGGATQTATTVGGVATFSGLPVGTYTFTATATGYGSGSVSVPVTAAGGSGSIPLASTIGTANITVTGPPSGTTVTVTLTNGTVTYSATTTTGVATFSNLPVGNYTFTASAPGYTSGSSSVTVTDTGGSASIPLTSSVGDVTITVYPSGSTTPLTTATVSLAVGSAVQTATTTSGAATFTGIPTGTYNFTASAPGYVTSGGTDTVTVTSSGGSASVQLAYATIAVTVTATSGGTVTPSASPPYHYNDTVTWTATPDTGYGIWQVLVNGSPVTVSATSYSYTVSPLIEAQSLYVQFGKPCVLSLTNASTAYMHVYDNGSYLGSVGWNKTTEFKVLPGHTVYLDCYTPTGSGVSKHPHTFIMPYPDYTVTF